MHRSVNNFNNIGYSILQFNPIQLKGQSDENSIVLYCINWFDRIGLDVEHT